MRLEHRVMVQISTLRPKADTLGSLTIKFVGSMDGAEGC